MNFTRKTSWHLEIFVCERSTILFFSILYYFFISMLQTELNEIWQHVERNNTLSYFIVHLQLLSVWEFWEKHLVGTSWIPILHRFIENKKKIESQRYWNTKIETFFEQMYFHIHLLETVSNESIKTDWIAIKRFDPFNYPQLTWKSAKHRTEF